MVNCEIWPSNLALKISWRTAKLSTQNIMVNCEIWPSKYHGKLRNWPSDFRGQLRNYSLQISCGVRAVFVISGASWIQWRLSLFFQDIRILAIALAFSVTATVNHWNGWVRDTRCSICYVLLLVSSICPMFLCMIGIAYSTDAVAILFGLAVGSCRTSAIFMTRYLITSV